MKVTLCGTRGSLASPGPNTVRYGGNTSCVLIQGSDSTSLILDAGSGIRPAAQLIPQETRQFHILLTHLHMDHVVGLPFFPPLLTPGLDVHIWGPASTTLTLEKRIHRYLSPPLFPLRLGEVQSNLQFHELPVDPVEIGEFRIKAELILHPNPTVGYRIQEDGVTVTYMPDHEPALGVIHYPASKEWTSGYALAEGSDLLIHDSQFTREEYVKRYGYGHSSIQQAMQFAQLCDVKEFVPFHHDPWHGDAQIDAMIEQALQELQPRMKVTPGMEGLGFELQRR